jgi:organic hydroperoxide reductase OsmC/OhrA
MLGPGGEFMLITANVMNRQGNHAVQLKSGEREHSVSIPPRPDGYGSYATGGELLLLALATCFCNDLYREAGKRGYVLDGVDVEVAGDFGGEGQPISNISYRATVITAAPKEKIFDLMTYTDSVAEIHNTLRQAAEITLTKCEVHSA